MKRKILLMILDGAGDRPSPEIGGKTPLEYAKRPNLDWFASNGICGLLDTIAPGVRPGSDTAHLALLGYDPYTTYTGRGPFEAAGLGLDVKQGDVAFRCNFATVDASGNVVDRRAGRIKGGTGQLAESLGGIHLGGTTEVIFKAAVEHRAVLVLRGEGLAPGASDTDPHGEGVPISRSSASTPAGEHTADLVNRFSDHALEVLGGHPVNKIRKEKGLPPANAVLIRGCGQAPKLDKITERYGIKAACVVGISLVKGVCRMAGFDTIDIRGVTGGADTDLEAKFTGAVKALEGHDLVLTNVKMPDLFGHDRKPREKAESFAAIDDALKIIRDRVGKDLVVAITADHSTPVTVGDHSGDPVPLVIVAPDARVDSVKHFDERSVVGGAIGRVTGKDLMPVLMNLANRSEKFGA